MSEKDPKTPLDLPRGASGAELDQLRASVRVGPRGSPAAAPSKPPPVAHAPPSPLPNALILKPEIDRMIDEGRALFESDPQAAHAVFERAYRRNLNDGRVLSNYGLTLVVVEGDRQRGIRFCEEAARRGPPTTEVLVNLARALVQTRNKEQAVRALRKAQELAPDDPRVGVEFVSLGLRRVPPIPWLPRAFFLNRWLGKLTWRMSRKRFDPAAPR
jgi:tetratricopeptide (TPR) repeat protein